MNVARVFRKRSIQQEDRLPISTYEEAVTRLLVIHEDEAIPDEAFNLAVSIVADIFWQTDLNVRRDVIVAASKLMGG